jgi:hypothetical protein
MGIFDYILMAAILSGAVWMLYRQFSDSLSGGGGCHGCGSGDCSGRKE